MSRVAQWKRAGPITQRSVDRNHALLNIFFTIQQSPFLKKVCVPPDLKDPNKEI